MGEEATSMPGKVPMVETQSTSPGPADMVVTYLGTLVHGQTKKEQ